MLALPMYILQYDWAKSAEERFLDTITSDWYRIRQLTIDDLGSMSLELSSSPILFCIPIHSFVIT
ncbi:hypothetical protein M408DRAFT_329422 [Serendipita vermifera MAFF 305830]|uniref:Uncharacterized protein n=1 Tax=Serendipita vermifera MAFF 305830 TaxID=933852 RepID=A0A0C2XGS1_SERVB|nr:hypothetical protein M408DRAFT_329422 [Serendipita vermifera MAFF 305830]